MGLPHVHLRHNLGIDEIIENDSSSSSSLSSSSEEMKIPKNLDFKNLKYFGSLKKSFGKVNFKTSKKDAFQSSTKKDLK